jgi:hypothetical protein
VPSKRIPIRVLAGVIGIVVFLVFALGACANTIEALQPKPAVVASAPSVRALAIGRGSLGRPIPAGFVGISMEFRAVETYAGTNPRSIDPAFEQLIRNLAPGQRPVLRVGGDSTDWTWWPVAHVAKPPGIRLSLDPSWMSVAHSLVRELKARTVFGINLEADRPRVAAGEANALIRNIGRRAIDALEVGNEPELYGTFNWYRTASGIGVRGRPRSYDPSAFEQDYSRFARALPRLPLAGPSTGAVPWMQQVGPFLSAEPRVGLVTLHTYPLKHCVPTDHPTAGQLLAESSSAGLAAGVGPFIHTAHSHRVPVRIDEMNGVTCGGYRGVSNAFASSLWILDALFEMARAGVDGVNVHSPPHALNEMFGTNLTHGIWRLKVHPEYYGMMMFAQAAPPGSRLLSRSWVLAGGVKAWATRARNGVLRVVLINKRLSGARTVRVRIAGAHGPASLERLKAPSVRATGGVTLGGQTFGSETTTGILSGQSRIATVRPAKGAYVVSLPAVSAAMLTIPASAGG